MTDRSNPYLAPQRERSPTLAAVLSFFVPGLGQMYAGHLLRGLLLAIPQTVVLVILVWLFLQDPIRLGSVLLLNAIPFAILNLLFLLYRAYAVLDAYRLARGERALAASRSGMAAGAIALVLLLTANVAVHGYAAYNSYLLDRTARDITGDCDDLDPNEPRPRNCPRPSRSPVATPTQAPTNPGDTPAPTITPDPNATPTPEPTPVLTVPPGTPYWAENGRLDVLLLGADQGEGRTGLRTDTMIVASIDVATGRSALIGVPRNVINAPLPDSLLIDNACRCLPDFLSGLFTFIRDGTVRFADGDDDGFRAISETIQHLLGIQLDGLVVVNLKGFVKAIDALGGIDINVPYAVYDEQYRNEDDEREVIDIKPGIQHMDGHVALMYVRSRHQDSDYGRMSRQQLFLRAVRAQFSACNLLPRIPALLEAMGDAVRTDIPLEDLPSMVDLATRSKQPKRVELIPPRGFGADWSKPALLGRIQAEVARAFEPRSPNASPDPEESLPPPPANPC